MAKEVRVFYSLFLNILFFLTFFCHTWFPFFFILLQKKETPKREKNREALSLVIITYRDILFLYDGFTLIPSSGAPKGQAIFLFLFFMKKGNQEKITSKRGK
jgi:hypothetical protein